jgi:hypothetical protein
MICHPGTLAGYAEWPNVADAVIEADFLVCSSSVLLLGSSCGCGLSAELTRDLDDLHGPTIRDITTPYCPKSRGALLFFFLSKMQIMNFSFLTLCVIISLTTTVDR